MEIRMKTQFVADFEAYMPAVFNDKPYGKPGLLSLADEAGIDFCVVFPAGEEISHCLGDFWH